MDFFRMLLERRYFDRETRLRVTETPPPRGDGLPYFYEVLGYVEVPAERVRELTTNLLAGLHSAGVRLRIWLRRGEDGTFRIWYGAERDSSHAGALLHELLEGNFVGMDLRKVDSDRAVGDRSRFAPWPSPVAGLIVGVPSERVETPVETRLDEALEALSRHEFELVLTCDPVSDGELDQHLDRLGKLAGMAHSQAKRSVSESEGRSYGESVTASLGRTVSEGTSWSTGTSSTDQREGAAGWGGLIGAAAGFAAVLAFPPLVALAPAIIPAGAAVGAAVGSLADAGGSTGKSATVGGSTNFSESEQVAFCTQLGASMQRQVTLESIDHSAELLEQMARAHLRRLQVARALGGWRVTIGIVAPTEHVLDTAAHALVGSLRGDDSWLEPPRLLRCAPDHMREAVASIRGFVHVNLRAPRHPFVPGGEHPSTLLSSLELAHWLRPPARDLPGVVIRQPVHFARSNPDPAASAVALGTLEYWGRKIGGSPVRISTASLCQHAVIAGTTGAGKTTTVRSILWQLAMDHDVPFLVMEPAKDEYRGLFDDLKRAGKRPLRLTVAGPVDPGSEGLLKFNPLAIPRGLVAGQHVEPIKILLRSSFAMQESLPQLLERVVADTYAEPPFGLDGERLGEVFTGGPVPTLRHLVFDGNSNLRPRILRAVRRFGYEKRVEDNLVAALTVRLESFGIGLKRRIFFDGDLDFDDVLARPTFINISGLPEPDVRRFLTAALFIRLYGERVTRSAPAATDTAPELKHLLVLEEAHHFLGRSTGAGPGAELTRESNLLMANAFAELRAFGQGILVADQAPGDLDPSVLRNTNTKICHRLFYEADCRAMADSMGLDDAQTVELRRLDPGQAVVFGPSHLRAVACRVSGKPPTGRSPTG